MSILVQICLIYPNFGLAKKDFKNLVLSLFFPIMIIYLHAKKIKKIYHVVSEKMRQRWTDGLKNRTNFIGTFGKNGDPKTVVRKDLSFN